MGVGMKVLIAGLMFHAQMVRQGSAQDGLGAPARPPDPRADRAPERAFIALADRAVGDIFPLWHYSVQYWECNDRCAPLNHTDGFSQKEILARCPRARKVASMELLGRGEEGWKARASRERGGVTEWDDVSVWVSEVVYSDRSRNIMPIYEGELVVVREKWATMVSAARAYPWAEQGTTEVSAYKTTDSFENWPKSLYKPFQTNSKTFVVHVLSEVGLEMVEMDGLHPGAMTPSCNREGSWTFHAIHRPRRPRGLPRLLLRDRVLIKSGVAAILLVGSSAMLRRYRRRRKYAGALARRAYQRGTEGEA